MSHLLRGFLGLLPLVLFLVVLPLVYVAFLMLVVVIPPWLFSINFYEESVGFRCS